jgi:hypothetical protein
MARVLDDIVHYFNGKGVDILATPAAELRSLCNGEADRIYEALGRREYPTGDLIAAVIEAEQYIAIVEREVRSLRFRNRELLKQQTKHPELYEEGT